MREQRRAAGNCCVGRSYSFAKADELPQQKTSPAAAKEHRKGGVCGKKKEIRTKIAVTASMTAN